MSRSMPRDYTSRGIVHVGIVMHILSLENDIARKLSFDETVREYDARKPEEYFAKICFMYDVICIVISVFPV